MQTQDTSKPTTKPEKLAAWRDAFDLTQAQVEVLAALIAAQNLGYDGATSRALWSIGLTKTQTHGITELERLRLVEVFGFVGETKTRIYRATDRAFRRLGQRRMWPIPPVVMTEAGQTELIAQRAEARRQRQKARTDRERAA